MTAVDYDVTVIGGGPAGLAAAVSASEAGARVLLIEREGRLGGILKQCIHDGFGLIRFGEKLTGPEYAYRFTRQLAGTNTTVLTLTYVTRIEQQADGFLISFVNREGAHSAFTKSLVLACGCRERTARQIGVHGDHCSGIFTAGTAQYYTNILGKMPTKRCVILGSGDIGLIMARRLTLEGAKVEGVYEAKPTASGLTRNIYQCLDDYDIPLYTSKTVTRVYGEGRLSAVEISDVDENMAPIPGTGETVECDALILSVGLIPENELAESLCIPLDERTKGPISDQNCMTMADGVFCCGNALHVNDLADYVSESGEAAGRAAAGRTAAGHTPRKRLFADLKADENFLYLVPQVISLRDLTAPVTVYFRSKCERGRTRLSVTFSGREVFKKTFLQLRPPEMERVEVDFRALDLESGATIQFSLAEVV